MEEQSTSHPFLPSNLIIPNYVPNDRELIELLGVFFGITFVVLTAAWLFSGRKEHLNGKYVTRVKICWFVMCALIHGILEGYFSIKHQTIASDQAFLAQLWKEYGKADSRYVTADPFTVCMETITAFVDGPLAAMAAYAFLYNTPSRHVVQVLLSVCQLYGDVLYFSTEVMEGFTHGPMYHPLYFWFYFVFLNVFWIVVPLTCIIESCVVLVKAQNASDSYKVRGKKNT